MQCHCVTHLTDVTLALFALTKIQSIDVLLLKLGVFSVLEMGYIAKRKMENKRQMQTCTQGANTGTAASVPFSTNTTSQPNKKQIKIHRIGISKKSNAILKGSAKNKRKITQTLCIPKQNADFADVENVRHQIENTNTRISLDCGENVNGEFLSITTPLNKISIDLLIQENDNILKNVLDVYNFFKIPNDPSDSGIDSELSDMADER